MTRTRVKRLVFLTALLIVAVLVLPYLLWSPRQLNHAGYARIEVGMSRAQVELLLGGPPGVYYPSYPGAGQIMTEEGYGVPGATETLWYDDRARYEIWFDPEGRVAGKHQRSGWTASDYSTRLTGFIDLLRRN